MHADHTVSVRWMTSREPHNKMGIRGQDFKACEPFWFGPHRGYLNWKEYAIWCAKGQSGRYPILRVWVNDELVWFYEKGWLVDLKTFEPS